MIISTSLLIETDCRNPLRHQAGWTSTRSRSVGSTTLPVRLAAQAFQTSAALTRFPGLTVKFLIVYSRQPAPHETNELFETAAYVLAGPFDR